MEKTKSSNREILNSMSNAEFADYIYGVSEGRKPCVICNGDCDFCEETPEQCKEKIGKWLESDKWD